MHLPQHRLDRGGRAHPEDRALRQGRRAAGDISPRRYLHLSGLRHRLERLQRGAAESGNGPHGPEGPPRRERRRGVQDARRQRHRGGRHGGLAHRHGEDALDPRARGRIHRGGEGEPGAPRLPQHRAGRAEHDDQRGVLRLREALSQGGGGPREVGQGAGPGRRDRRAGDPGRAPLPSRLREGDPRQEAGGADGGADGERGPRRATGGAAESGNRQGTGRPEDRRCTGRPGPGEAARRRRLLRVPARGRGHPGREEGARAGRGEDEQGDERGGRARDGQAERRRGAEGQADHLPSLGEQGGRPADPEPQRSAGAVGVRRNVLPQARGEGARRFDVTSLKLTLEYDGTDFVGWQVQANGRSVQDELEKGIARLYGAPVRVTGAGRTDAGVHARGQVASLQFDRELPIKAWTAGLNALLPEDLACVRAETAPDGFDARRWARGKRYTYTILQTPVRAPLLRGRAWEIRRPLDIEASAFLKHMVRNIVGTLVEVGHGRRDPGSLPALLEGRDRTQAGPTAPPHGLVLDEVFYLPGNVIPHPEGRE